MISISLFALIYFGMKSYFMQHRAEGGVEKGWWSLTILHLANLILFGRLDLDKKKANRFPARWVNFYDCETNIKLLKKREKDSDKAVKTFSYILLLNLAKFSTSRHL